MSAGTATPEAGQDTGTATGQAPPAGPGPARRLRFRRLLTGALTLIIVAGVFGFALPRLASYGVVWQSLSSMHWSGLLIIAGTVAASQVATWAAITAVLPTVRLRHAAVVNLASSAVANTVPGGGAVALGMSWAMLSRWGIGTSQYVQYTLVSGLWNVFVRLGLPVAAVALIVVGGQASEAWQAAAYAGAGLLAVMIGGLWAMLRSERVARRADRALARAVAAAARLARRPPPRRSEGLVSDFRADTSALLAGRWPQITLATLASHLSLWLVLLACLRAGGVSGAQVSWAASLAAFAFVRLLSVLPITPGGVGVVELGLTGPLAVGLGPGAAARVAAAVLLFRAATFLLPLPAGGGAYLWWRYRVARAAD